MGKAAATHASLLMPHACPNVRPEHAESHLPDHGQDQRPATHRLAEVALQQGAHLLLQDVGITKLLGSAFTKDACQHAAHFVEHFLAGVDVHEAAGDDLGLPDEHSVRVDGHDDDHEAFFGEVLPVAHDY